MGKYTIGLDVETSKIPYFHPWQKESFLVSVGIVDDHDLKRVWLFNHNEMDPMKERSHSQKIKEIQHVVNQAGRIVAHNAKFDLNWLRDLGVSFDHARVYCTQVAEYLIHGQNRRVKISLAETSKRYGIKPKIDKVKMYWDSGYETNAIPLDVLNPYLIRDCENTLEIFHKQVPILKEKGLEWLMLVESETLRTLSSIEVNGWKLDKETAEEILQENKDKLQKIDQELKSLFGREDLNLNSGHELSAALFGGVLKREGKEVYITTRKCNYKEPYLFHYKDPKKKPVWKTRNRRLDELITKSRRTIDKVQHPGIGFRPQPNWETKHPGIYSTDKNIIKMLKPVGNPTRRKKQKRVKELLKDRSVTGKIIESFVGTKGDKGILNKMQPTGFVHSQYNQTVTKTGRLSSKDPNGQNLFDEIKKAIKPRNDFILDVDLSQLEWRVAGFLSQDPVIIKEIKEGVDQHYFNAINFFGADPDAKNFEKTRKTAKIFTFRLLYGGSPFSFYMDGKMPNFSLKKWEGIVSAFMNKYQGLDQWQKDNVEIVNRQGYLVNPTGRILTFHKGPDGTYSETQIKNYPVQSLATGDIMKLAMVVIAKRMRDRGFRSLIIMQVHDSIVLDAVKEELQDLARLCIQVFEELPKLIKRTWGFDFNLPLTGDAEYGTNYCDTKKMDLKR